jgi:hypothetical protein
MNRMIIDAVETAMMPQGMAIMGEMIGLSKGFRMIWYLISIRLIHKFT